jgi:rod shape-determining protein MreC
VDERRTGWLLLAILAAQLALLASGVPAADGKGSVLEAVGLRLVAPLARLTAAAGGAFDEVREGWRGHRSLVAENRELADEVERLSLEVTRLQRLEGESRQLAAALERVAVAPQPLEVVDVVYLDHTSWLRTLIFRREGGEVEVNQPVLAAAGLVGRVVQVAGAYGRAQLITDGAASVGAMIERTGRQGIVRGRGGGDLELAFVPLQADVAVGDRVVTAGIDGVYPPGLLVGSVTEVEPGDELFYRIGVAPAVDFGRRLEHLYLLARQRLPEELTRPLPGALR